MLSAAKLRIEALEKQMRQQTITHINFKNSEETIIYGSDQNKLYIPTFTGNDFHNGSDFVRLVMGPYGSGKSTLCINEIVRRACSMPNWSHGQRRSRWLVIRNTSGELYSTTLQTWLAWFGELGDIKKRQKPLLTYEHTFNDGEGIT